MSAEPNAELKTTQIPDLPAASQPRAQQRYQIICEHGRGGLGRVFRVHDRELCRDIAIKELLSRGPSHEVRFVREASITARLEHPGIVPVYEVGRWPDGTPFYAMKLVAGRPLRELIAERTTVKQRIGLLHHVVAVADALAYAHGRNIIHRDLKPANVIVGDFGETIVIDWGLAKDLTAVDEPTSGGPSPVHRDDQLTSTGSVLGTPSYMAPEQARGERVDQRADVFAIGAMLWELCAIEKVPPTDRHLRHRILRRAGIDRDLVTIVDKALEPDPTHRYANAGALAADLKAFKSGARIAARTYSLPAMLGHWVRRHRALAFSLMFAVVIAGVGSTSYVYNVATERDLADAAFTRSEADRNALMLEHAALLLHSDPTAALAALAGYHGHDEVRRAQLRAEAYGRGRARRVLKLHNDTVWLLAEQTDGALVSIAEDRRVLRTTERGTVMLATDASVGTVVPVYSAARELVAYERSPNGVALLDLRTLRTVQIPSSSLASLVFSSDGTKLALLSRRGEVAVWDVARAPTVIHRGSAAGVHRMRFLPDDDISLLSRSKIEVQSLGGGTASRSLAAQSADTGTDLIAVGQVDGVLALLSRDLKIVTTLPVCKQRVTSTSFVPHRPLIAFGCSEGGAGLLRYSVSDRTLQSETQFHTEGAVIRLLAEPSGAYIAVSSGDNVYVHYIDAGLTRRLVGQGALISVLATSAAGAPRLFVGDVNGGVREWAISAPPARVIARTPKSPIGISFAPDGANVAVYGRDPVIQLISTKGEPKTELRGHTGMVGGAHFASDGSRMMTFSWDGTAQVWSLPNGEHLRSFTDHESTVEDGDILAGGQQAVTVGDDGKLRRWSTDDGHANICFASSEPFVALEVLRNTNSVVVHDVGNALWVVTPTCKATQLQPANPDAITILRASPDGMYLGIGRESGSVTVYRTADWSIAMEFNIGGDVGRIAFNPKRSELLVLAENGLVQLISLEPHSLLPWSILHVPAKEIAYAADGQTLAIVTMEGGTWFYSFAKGIWRYVLDHNAELRSGRFSPNGSRFASVDDDGVVVLRELEATFMGEPDAYE